jgi:hypothetical protein
MVAEQWSLDLDEVELKGRGEAMGDPSKGGILFYLHVP